MLIDKILQKKGIYQVLKTLQISSKNYNVLKGEIRDYFSARTLDHRLKELLDLDVLRLKDSDEKNLKSYYYLTERGRILFTVLDGLEQLFSERVEGAQFLNLISTNLKLNEALHFEAIWEELKDILANKSILYTLGKGKPNNILDVDDSGITVETGKGESLIEIEMIKTAWEYLVKDGFLHRSEHEKASYRSSFMLTLFNELDYVEIDQTRPLVIKLNEGQLPKLGGSYGT